MHQMSVRLIAVVGAVTCGCLPVQSANYEVVDTGQAACYNHLGAEITCPQPGDPFHGQDAQYAGVQPDYVVSGDGLTVYDNNTGLTWQRTPDTDGDGDVDNDDTLTWADAQAYAATLNAQNYGGFNDWRSPTIKELYSLMDFRGIDPSGFMGDPADLVPFIDTTYFDFVYGDESAGVRLIDAQYWSSTEYASTTMNGDATAFGVNFADGRIKGYPSEPVGPPGQEMTKLSFVRFVRGNPNYGTNNFVDNDDGTVTDLNTELMWQQADSVTDLNWEGALDYCENLTFANEDDWRLPNAKELQTILDYTRSPDTSGSAAIDSIFSVTTIVDEGGGANYPFYWTSTTHANWSADPGAWGAYFAFGEALGWMEAPPGSGSYVLWDVHGAGAQRSDPKDGDPANWPLGNGPQGDIVRIFNHVRCVRDVTQVPGDAPAVSEWGQIAMLLLVLTAGTLVYRCRLTSRCIRLPGS